ncbi:Carnitine O-acetyltransferase [Nymphon striatum]|nr:Carnitine O-acetyltransferase [Nymphon striatum]
MERKILGVSWRDRKTNSWVRTHTKCKDLTQTVKSSKYQLAFFHDGTSRCSTSQRTNQYEVATPVNNNGKIANKLPLPNIKPTIVKYLRSVKPLINELRYKQTKSVAKDFISPGGVGERLQLILEERSRHTENWQYDTYRNISYLDRRLPLPVYCNPTGQIFCKDWNEDNQLWSFCKIPVNFKSSTVFVVSFDTFPYATYLGKQLDKRQWQLVFSSCRFPANPKDYVVHYGYLKEPPSHVVVAYKNQFFRVDTIGSDKLSLSTDQIFSQLTQIANMAIPKSEAQPVGLLTCLPRDQWADMFNVLQQDPENRKSLENIQKSILFMAIDSSATDDEFSPDPLIRLMEYGLHAGGSKNNGGNRWFDKQQYVVHSKQGFGTIMEHSILDGYPSMWVLFTAEKEMLNDSGTDVTNDKNIPGPIPLKFNVTTEVEAGIARGTEYLDWSSMMTLTCGKCVEVKLTEQNDLSYTEIIDFGGARIQAKGFSPDSFLQMAQMLAYYRNSRSSTSPSCKNRYHKMHQSGMLDLLSDDDGQQNKQTRKI